jgi:acyl carrier protein phosphodiesterase
MIGNFIADHVKGKQLATFSSGIQKGIKMHRAIDDYTDHHKVVRESKERLYPTYGKYAPVIVDMFYDHLLASNWEKYSPISLPQFSSACYQLLEARQQAIPERSQRMLYYMKRGDWLSSYATKEGIGGALSGLAQRASFDSKMEHAVGDLFRDREAYLDEFERFFPQLIEFTAPYTRLED